VSLKGGQNNFGIVTRFDIDTVPQTRMWGGLIAYPNASVVKVLDTFTDFKSPKKFDPHAMLIMFSNYNTTLDAFGAAAGVYHARPEAVGGSTLEAFAKIQPQVGSTVRIDSVASFAGEIDEGDSTSTP
jgi:hypothetical protein